MFVKNGSINVRDKIKEPATFNSSFFIYSIGRNEKI
jgi:hypothetical protein